MAEMRHWNDEMKRYNIEISKYAKTMVHIGGNQMMGEKCSDVF